MGHATERCARAARDAFDFCGTTVSGGVDGKKFGYGGTVFKLAPDGQKTILHEFRCHDDGRTPLAGLMIDMAGSLYGTTINGGGSPRGCNGFRCGAVFEISPGGKKKMLHASIRQMTT